MGDRLRDYGFMNPFRRDQHLSGGGIDQWLNDVVTYNNIIKTYNLTSQIEYKQPDGTWSVNPPPKPSTTLIVSNLNNNAGYFVTSPNNNVNKQVIKGETVETMPEYRWKISGDINGANQALKNSGITGNKFQNIVDGNSVYARNVPAPGARPVGATKFYVNSSDPLGMGIGDATGSAFARAYKGETAPSYYTFVGKEPGYENIKHNDWTLSPDYGLYYAKQIADQIFSNPNLGNVKYDPTAFSAGLSATPAIRDQIGTYINDTASVWRSRDDGGGALGVIAAGLSGVAQFASMAAGLNGLVSGLSALTSGAGLGGAFSAGLNAAGSMPDIGSVIGGIAGSPTIGNIANIGVGGIVGGEAGGLPGAALGAGGALIGAGIDQAGGIREFIRDPLGNITGAIGLGGEILSGAQLAAMEAAGQINLGSTAQNLAGGVPDYSMEVIGGASNLLGGGTGSSLGGTIGSAIGGNLAGGSVISAPGNVNFTGSYVDPTTGQVVEQYEVVAESGDTTQAGGGMGSSAGGGAGSAIGDMLGGGGASTGPSSTGGLLDGNVTPGTPGNPTGSIQTTQPGTGTGIGGPGTTGAGTGASGVIYGPDGLPIGTAGPYSDAAGTPGSYQGPTGGSINGTIGGFPGGAFEGMGTVPGGQYDDSKFDIIGNMIPNLGPWDFTGAPSGPGTPNVTGLLDTGTAGTGPGGTGPGGDGLGGDGLGGDGTGTGGLGDPYNMFDYSGLLGGMTPGSIGDPASFITPRAYGVKKKGPASFYGKLQAPKKRKGVTVRRA